MWQVGDVVKTHSPVHGEMLGTIINISRQRYNTIYHVVWQTSKTGTIESKELAGRDDLSWIPVETGSEATGTEPITLEQNLEPFAADQPSPEGAFRDAILVDPRLRSSHTHRTYLADLEKFEQFRTGREINVAVVNDYLQNLESGGKSPAALNRFLASIRWWARTSIQRLETRDAPSSDLDSSRLLELYRIRFLPNVPPRAVRPLKSTSFEDLHLIQEVCRQDPSPAGKRDLAMLYLASAGELKRGELVGLQLNQARQQNGGHFLVQIDRASGKSRTIELDGEAGLALNEWLAARRAQDISWSTGPFFLSINKSGKILPKGLSGEALRQILNKRASQAGLEGLTWEALRGPHRPVR